jgi:hypothetical protein
MSTARLFGLIAAVAAVSTPSAPARAQEAPPPEAAPQVFVDGQPVGDLPPPSPEGVRVDLWADSPNVRLMRVDGPSPTVVCAPPCGVIVPSQGVYQIAGDGVVRTSRFSVPTDHPDLQLHVKSGSNAQRWGGIVIGAIGYTTVLLGESLATYDPMPGTQPPSWRTKEVGLTMMAAGLVVGTVGLVMILTANTSVSSSSGASFSHAAPRGRRTAIRLTAAGLEF